MACISGGDIDDSDRAARLNGMQQFGILKEQIIVFMSHDADVAPGRPRKLVTELIAKAGSCGKRSCPSPYKKIPARETIEWVLKCSCYLV